MSRWRFEVYRDGEDEPSSSHLVFAERLPGGAPAVTSELSVSVQVAAEDDRVVRIELRREPN
jgi:hypothetical protein